MQRLRTLPVTRRRRGFSLLEVMLALTILAVGVLGVTAAQLASLKLSGTSKSHGLALSLAEQQMEIFQSTTMADLLAEIAKGTYPNDPNNPITLDPGGGSPITFDRSWNIEADTPEAGIARITINVAWADEYHTSRTASVQGLKADW